MKTKKLIIFIKLLLILGLSDLFLTDKKLLAQCIANAGNDTTFCVTHGLDTFYLGGYPAVTGGVPPYIYTWSCDYNASNFLNDTTIANPYFISSFNDTMTFYLTVEDSTGYICSDSVRVSICEYVFISQIPIYINQGDSAIIFGSTSGGCPPITFQWTPIYNISDPFIPNPIVWPDTTTTYYLTITDAAGCEVFDYCEVIVSSLDVIDIAKANFEIKLFPNPASKKINIKLNVPSTVNSLMLEISNVRGISYKKWNLSNLDYQGTYQIEISDMPNGMYFISLFLDNIKVKTEKIIINK